MRALTVLLLAAAFASAQDSRAQRLAARAKKTADAIKPLWKQFVFEQDELTEDDLKKLITTYDKAIDLFQQAQEIQETAAINSTILVLTRKATQARFALMSRVVRKKQAATPKPPPEEKPPERPGEPEEPEPEPPEPEEPAPEEPAVRTKDGLPVLEEPPAQRRRGTQALRNFLMNHYLPNRKFSKIVTRCSVCNGSGRKKTNYLDENRKVITVKCPSCRESGYHLNESVARRAYWLVYSPLYRNDQQNRVAFESRLDQWRNDPRQMPEFLSRLKIVYVDYYGLWAEVTWQEHGRTPSNRKFVRTVRKKLLRTGKRWFLYDKRFDQAFFSTEGESDG